MTDRVSSCPTSLEPITSDFVSSTINEYLHAPDAPQRCSGGASEGSMGLVLCCCTASFVTFAS